MTTTQPSTTACPQCHADDSIEVGVTDRLCLQCRHEWNPAQVRLQPVLAVVPPTFDSDDGDDVNRILAAESLDDALGEPLTAAERIAEHTGVPLDDDDDDDPLLGTFVAVEGHEDLALVVETVPIDRYVVEYANGNRRTVNRADLAPVDLDDTQLDESPDATPDNDAPLVGTIAAVAALCLTVGAEAVANDESRTLLNPRIGWLPPPASDIPEVEQGAAYAVAILVSTFNLDADAVIAIGQSLMAGAAAEAAETSEQ